MRKLTKILKNRDTYQIITLNHKPKDIKPDFISLIVYKDMKNLVNIYQKIK